jgi:hypothetical protein
MRGFFLDVMRAIAIIEESIGIGPGAPWLLWFVAAGFLSWRSISISLFPVDGPLNRKALMRRALPDGRAMRVKGRSWPDGK